MIITADDKIPLVQELFAEFANIEQIPSHDISQQRLQHTDVLLIRSVTPVNEKLLNQTPVQFVGSMTAGINHLDIDWLNQKGIPWRYAAGANAIAVCEYVLACIAVAYKEKIFSRQKIRVGVIGAGLIGHRLITQLHALHFEVIYFDPFRPCIKPHWKSCDLSEFSDLDVITIHTPLTQSLPHATYHLIDEHFLKRQKDQCMLINTSRGAVIDQKALIKATNIVACIDTWENEPNISTALLKQCFIATPHIAGYTEEAKLRATLLIYQQLQPFFRLPQLSDIEKIIADYLPPLMQSSILEPYNPLKDTAYLKENLLRDNIDVGEQFEKIRKAYPLRREGGRQLPASS